MTGEHAQLSLRRTGGLAGLPLQATLDTRSLEQAKAREIIGALDRFGAEGQPHEAPASRPGAADTMHYELKVVRDGAARTASFSERQMPEALAPVIRVLMERAEPAPRSR
jgi:hypothetical protein